MMLHQYLDSTYLKTASQDGITAQEHLKKNTFFINEAIRERFKLIMLLPEMVTHAKSLINKAQSDVLVGTVIDFPLGNATTNEKLHQAQKALDYGADELDFVIDYKAFIQGNISKVKDELITCTQLVIDNGKTAKWIIETAALDNEQIQHLCTLIKETILSHFPNQDTYSDVFVKSSTGFYPTPTNVPNGATSENIKLMLQYAHPLPVKASGGVRNRQQALELIALGVKRIGTSSAKEIVDGKDTLGTY
ncbi:MAG: deoxyribose-phosphate aldolase [Bacteroidota bacterium]|nr:deoxyribose-phosphate aldolase [Bacteroidota bacterium]